MLGIQRCDDFIILGHFELSAAFQLTMPIDDRDLMLLQKMLDPTGKLTGHLTGPVHGFLKIDGGALDLDAECFRMLDQGIDISGSQKRLCRDTAPVQADAAEVFPLDNRGF